MIHLLRPRSHSLLLHNPHLQKSRTCCLLMNAIILLHIWSVDDEKYLLLTVKKENSLKRCVGTRLNASFPLLYNCRFAIEGDKASNYTFLSQNTNSNSRSCSKESYSCFYCSCLVHSWSNSFLFFISFFAFLMG